MMAMVHLIMMMLMFADNTHPRRTCSAMGRVATGVGMAIAASLTGLAAASPPSNGDLDANEFPREAYVTLVTTPEYVIGAETLAKVKMQMP